ncbi:MAG: phospholipid carrier-dependent glycosyltransferase [Candidatus Babeliales bacterium]|nr:phospholipid carrier-dependent glycosyltransferase [Candidatus Babeliales bacterium]
MFALSHRPTWKNLLLLFFVAFAVRAGTFFFYVQHEERYRQADSNDYHVGALTMGLGAGMVKIHNGQPVFWRTPGYPLYLSLFYRYFGIKTADFAGNMPAQKAALWVQILLCSLIPLILFFLALSLTGSLPIAWITSWISAVHLGLILASSFLLTEGLTLIFFYLFLLFFYKSFTCYGESHKSGHWVWYIAGSALSLGIATWIRPMGQFVAIVCALIIALLGKDGWKLKSKKIFLFLLIFFGSIAPWYVRNYKLTGKPFFCPMFGLYLNSFVAPKILRSLYGVPFQKGWKHLQEAAQTKAIAQMPIAQASGKYLVLEDISGEVAWPIVLAHPWYAFTAWMPEVIKSTFDLYSTQLTAFANNCWKWDPLEEFLPEKLAECLYSKPMPITMRLIAWFELLCSLALWISLLIGAWRFVLSPLFHRFKVAPSIQATAALWVKTGLLIGAVLFMTGGFGYARLRLPIEPLMIILALTVWFPIKTKPE